MHQCEERFEGGSPGAAGGGGCVQEVHAVTWHLAIGGLVKVNGYIHQEPCVVWQAMQLPLTVTAPPFPVKKTQPIAPTLRPYRRGGGVGMTGIG
jgi:hypothetical protein